MDNRLLYSMLTQQLGELKLGISKILTEELATLKYSISEAIGDEASLLKSLMQGSTKDLDERLIKFESRVLSALGPQNDITLAQSSSKASRNRAGHLNMNSNHALTVDHRAGEQEIENKDPLLVNRVNGTLEDHHFSASQHALGQASR